MKYEFTEDMEEISGFGGSYEDCCRKMLIAALEWLDDHPGSDPKFHGFKNIYGVICEDNDDAKALSKAATDAAGEYGATGAMHQATISAALWIKAHGWHAFVEAKTHPEGHVGILKDKLAQFQKNNETLRTRLDEETKEKDRRGEILASKLLGWRRYKTSNGQQEAWGPSQEAVLNDLYAGCSLHKLVDAAVADESPAWLNSVPEIAKVTKTPKHSTAQ